MLLIRLNQNSKLTYCSVYRNQSMRRSQIRSKTSLRSEKSLEPSDTEAVLTVQRPFHFHSLLFFKQLPVRDQRMYDEIYVS